MADLTVWHHRAGLARTRQRLAAGELTVGFIGGSITDPRAMCNWPEIVVAWLVEHFPQARIKVENAAIGATGSDLAVFRAERDLVGRGCDLVFIEFAVNDGGTPTIRRQRTREGLIRRLLAGEGRDVVLAYTFVPDLFAEMDAGRVPATIAEFELLADHYALGSVWMGLYALNEVRAGRFARDVFLPDNVHPQHRGSLSYAQSVTAFLERELLTSPSPGAAPVGPHRPAPLDPAHWEHATSVPLDSLRTTGPWALHRWCHCPWIDRVLATSAPGATCTCQFTGRVIALGLDFGKTTTDFRYRLDGGEWVTAPVDRPDWAGLVGWYRLFVLRDDLPLAPHELTVEVLFGTTAMTVGHFRLALVGVVP